MQLQPNLTPSPTLFYILGALKGDGWIARRWYKKKSYQTFIVLYSGIGEKARIFAESIAQSMREIGLNPRLWMDKKRSHQHRVIAQSKVFVEWYQNLSLVDIESTLSSSVPMMRAFIRGLYEAEGSITRTNCGRTYRVEIATKDEELMRLIHRLLKEHGYNVHFYTREREGFYKVGLRKEHRVIIFDLVNVKRFLNEMAPCIKNVPVSPSLSLFP